jgi:hypothetical protein
MDQGAAHRAGGAGRLLPPDLVRHQRAQDSPRALRGSLSANERAGRSR